MPLNSLQATKKLPNRFDSFEDLLTFATTTIDIYVLIYETIFLLITKALDFAFPRNPAQRRQSAIH